MKPKPGKCEKINERKKSPVKRLIKWTNLQQEKRRNKLLISGIKQDIQDITVDTTDIKRIIRE